MVVAPAHTPRAQSQNSQAVGTSHVHDFGLNLGKVDILPGPDRKILFSRFFVIVFAKYSTVRRIPRKPSPGVTGVLGRGQLS